MAVLLPPSSLMSVMAADRNCSLVKVVTGYVEPLGLCHTAPEGMIEIYNLDCMNFC